MARSFFLPWASRFAGSGPLGSRALGLSSSVKPGTPKHNSLGFRV